MKRNRKLYCTYVLYRFDVFIIKNFFMQKGNNLLILSLTKKKIPEKTSLISNSVLYKILNIQEKGTFLGIPGPP